MGTLTGQPRKRLSPKQLRQSAPDRAASAGPQGPCRAAASSAESRSTSQTGSYDLRPPRSRRSRGRSIVGSSSLPWRRSSPWADAPSPTCSVFWASWLPDTPVVITGSSPATAGRSRPWHAVMSRRCSLVSSRAGTVLLAGDDTVTEHPGPHVYGKGRHRDPVRSTHTYTAFRWGHKWVVLTVLVPVPWATRRWALPLLVALYRPKEENLKCGRRHKTPAQLLGQMVRILKRWFPDRTFVVTADGGYASHELAELAARTGRKWTLVSLFYPNANLVEPPPPYSGNGRPRKKGKDRAGPAEVVEKTTQRQTLVVAWYGGGRRRVEVVTGTGLWYKKRLSPGEFALGLRPRPERNAPGSVFLQH